MKIVELSKAEKLEGTKYALYRMVNPVTLGSKNFMSFVVIVDEGGEIPEHRHGPAEVAVHFLQGKASVTIDGEERVIQPEVAVHVPIRSTIGLKNIGKEKLKFIAVLSPPIDVNICPVCGIEIKP